MEQKTEASQAVKFRKKPVEIEAIQWTGSNLLSIIEFTDGRKPDNRHDFAAMKWDEYAELVKRDGLKIFTLEGKMNADVGDWIIKGVKNEFYPCKPDIFEMTYERAALKSQPPVPFDRNTVLDEVAALFPQPYMEYFGSDIQESIAALKDQLAPTEAAKGDVLAGYTKWMHDSSKYPHSDDMRHPFEAFKAGTKWAQPSGNTGELAQGEDSALLAQDCIESIASGHGYMDSYGSFHCACCGANLDEKEDHSDECLTIRAQKFLARASAETGGVKS